ncbi:MAG: iron ABC transporter permease [Eubacteriales bacterium]|nr:iron ABC transporter permease [Eubacteriales bacterium]
MAYHRSKQGRSLERRKLWGDPVLLITIVLLSLFLFLFILYPLLTLLLDSIRGEGKLGFEVYGRVLDLKRFRQAFSNTLVLGAISGFGSTLIGLLFAYVDIYVTLRRRAVSGLFRTVALLPVVSPPFVLSLSMILLFGRTGLISRSLLGMRHSNVYGLHGIAVVQILTFFPVCYLMLKGLLTNIDPSLEEAARDMGASRWKVFVTVTLPLLLPGLGNAFLVTFIEAVADFANPMLIGGSYDTLATTIYLQITGSYDGTGAAAMSVMLLGLTLVLFLIQKYALERKTVSTLTGKASRMRAGIQDRSVTVPLTILCSAVASFVILLYIMVPFGALFKLWGKNYSLSLQWFEYVFKYDGMNAFRDSFALSAIAAPLTALLSMIIAYLVVKRRFGMRPVIEFVSMLAMAVPGTVLGIGYIRAYANGLFGSAHWPAFQEGGSLHQIMPHGLLGSIYGSSLVLILVFIVRSLPVGTRSGISALRQIDKSIEEAAYDLGAQSGKVFRTITLPLIRQSFLSGLVTSFVRSITAISAVILLVTPQYVLITVRINEFAEKGYYGVACAYATILIGITYAAIFIMNWVLERMDNSSRSPRARARWRRRRGLEAL